MTSFFLSLLVTWTCYKKVFFLFFYYLSRQWNIVVYLCIQEKKVRLFNTHL